MTDDSARSMRTKTTTSPPEGERAASGRLWQIDALRGAMLVLMTLTHLPTRFSSPLGQPLGHVSAAEGFVLLSAFMAGWVYRSRQLRSGADEMRSAFLKRVVKIYLAQAALLLFLFSAVSVIGLVSRQPAITDLVAFYLQHPVEAVAGALLLVYNPPLLDILPMYVLFMLASSLVLVHAGRRGWGRLLAVSIAIWLGAQFGLGALLYDLAVQATGFAIPHEEIGAFDILAWQLLWAIGLWLGASHADGQARVVFPRWLVVAAIAIGAIGLVWRHAVGQVPFPGRDDLNLLFDKWQLGPLRLLDLFALMVLAMHFEPWLVRHLPRLRSLEKLGAASLPVFCAHLVIALLALAVLGQPTPERSLWLDLALLAGAFGLLYAVALVSERIDRRAARVRAAFDAARAERQRGNAVSEGARRSPFSKERSRRR